MRRTHGFLLGLALVSSSLVGCGGGGGGGAPGGGATAALNAQEQSLLGTWTLVGFDVWFYDSGEHYTQNSFGSFSGSLTFSADGTADGTLCLNNSCAALAFDWSVSGGTFYADGAGVPFQLQNGVFTVDFYDPNENTREVKYYVRDDAAAFAARVETPDAAELPAAPFGRAIRAVVDAN
jgi:hypothetical protein